MEKVLKMISKIFVSSLMVTSLLPGAVSTGSERLSKELRLANGHESGLVDVIVQYRHAPREADHLKVTDAGGSGSSNWRKIPKSSTSVRIAS